ncbi:hypothetical protein GCM10029978_067810 [Actinoallomurus acanthiterrae]
MDFLALSDLQVLQAARQIFTRRGMHKGALIDPNGSGRVDLVGAIGLVLGGVIRTDHAEDGATEVWLRLSDPIWDRIERLHDSLLMPFNPPNRRYVNAIQANDQSMTTQNDVQHWFAAAIRRAEQRQPRTVPVPEFVYA